MCCVLRVLGGRWPPYARRDCLSTYSAATAGTTALFERLHAMHATWPLATVVFSALAVRQLVVGVPVLPGDLDPVALQAKLADALVAAIDRKPLLVAEVALQVARFNLGVGLEEPAFHHFQTRAHAFLRVGRLARQPLVLDELDVSLFLRQVVLGAPFAFEGNEPLPQLVRHALGHIRVQYCSVCRASARSHSPRGIGPWARQRRAHDVDDVSVFDARSDERGAFEKPFSNDWFWVAVGLSFSCLLRSYTSRSCSRHSRS